MKEAKGYHKIKGRGVARADTTRTNMTQFIRGTAANLTVPTTYALYKAKY